MTYVKNAILGVLAIALIAGAAPASAQTTADMQAQIAALLAQVQALTAQLNAGTGATVTFTRNLTVGSSGSDVKSLQQYLNGTSCPVATAGVGSVGLETIFFGSLTKTAVACWQAAHNISPAVGYFGPTTRAAVNAMVVVTPPGVTPPGTTPGLVGGAGSVDTYSLASGLSNEKVGEDANDVKVAGLEVENGDGSDLQFTALRLIFNEGGVGTTHDFEDYADEVSIWLGTNEVARVNSSEFNSDNDWTKTVSLDSDAIIRSGKTGTFYVAISGVKNLDSADENDTWTLDFDTARFRDAQGATISESVNTSLITFSFAPFASAADTEFKITDGLASVNDAHVVNIHATNDTNNVSILSFNVEVKGDSDINLDALPVTVTTSASSIYAFLSGLSLWMDGEEVGSANLSTDCLDVADCTAATTTLTYLFDNLDLNLNAGSDYDFLVKADIQSVADAGVAEGDTIFASFGETNTDMTSFKAKDESGKKLAAGDTNTDSLVNGTVVSDASEVRDVGINVNLVSVSGQKTFSRDATVTSTNDQGTFTITFDVTAFDGDVWIDKTAPTTTPVGNSGVSFAGSETLLASSIVKTSGSATEELNGYKIAQGQTARFTITGILEPTADGLYDMQLDNLRYALSNIDGNLSYTFNLTDFKTGQVFLDFGAV